MAKSWDAYDKLLFDARYPGYNGAIAGGGNLVYLGYEPNTPKSGCGVGVTRVHTILRDQK
jgi:histidyl-tRNA synthetase